MFTHLEDYISELYRSIGITKPEDLNMLQIAKKLGVDVTYSNRVFRFDNEIVIQRGTTSEEWTMFGHELCHYLRHSGNQLKMGKWFVELQEWQADNFMYQFCVPSFMLQALKLPAHEREAVWLIMETFHVGQEFAEKRLQHYMQNQIYRRGLDDFKTLPPESQRNKKITGTPIRRMLR